MEQSFEKFQRDFYSIWSRVNLLYSRWAEQIGVSYGVLVVLYGLDVHGSMTQKNICDFYGLPKQTVNGAVRGRAADGYVVLEKSREDRREKLVVLTDKGRAYAREKLKPIYEGERYAYSMIGGGKVFQMLDVMDAFHTLMKKRMEEES